MLCLPCSICEEYIITPSEKNHIAAITKVRYCSLCSAQPEGIGTTTIKREQQCWNIVVLHLTSCYNFCRFFDIGQIVGMPLYSPQNFYRTKRSVNSIVRIVTSDLRCQIKLLRSSDHLRQLFSSELVVLAYAFMLGVISTDVNITILVF